MHEAELARLCARGDAQAREELYRTYSPRLLALCMRYAPDRSSAEDLMQDAFVKVFRVIRKFRWEREGSLYSWMARVTLNLCFDSMKKRRRLAALFREESGLERIPDDPPDYDEAASIPADRLQAMVEELPEGYRTVFKLHCLEGMSHKEIASLLGIKENSASCSLSRARMILSKKIKEYNYED
jgi:RNA polymerase sigma-70 factor (ECF subfamily)